MQLSRAFAVLGQAKTLTALCRLAWNSSFFKKRIDEEKVTRRGNSRKGWRA
jgi:hypothetical protein